MNLGIALARLIIGALFIGHGTQKLFGWFGGHGREGTAGFFESLGLTPGDRNAVAAGVSEAAGGTLLAAGLLTPIGSTLISGPMITAIRKVHAPNGPWVTESGYEYNLVLLAAVFAIADAGPGAFSLDRALGIDLSGPGWAIAQLGAAAAGSAILIAQAEKASPAAQAAAPAGDPSTANA